ncbi:MAG: MarR family winged helix-turn-helix transcriptional regulator [Actinomycetales bacterium]
MPDMHTLAETERATSTRIGRLPVDMAAAHAVSSLYRAANAARAHLTNTVLRANDLTWTGFLVLWLLWIWGGMATKDVAESVGISKATLSGVANTLVSRGWVQRIGSTTDRRLVELRLTPEGSTLMDSLYPQFNNAESGVVAQLSPDEVRQLTKLLRSVVTSLEK